MEFAQSLIFRFISMFIITAIVIVLISFISVDAELRQQPNIDWTSHVQIESLNKDTVSHPFHFTSSSRHKRALQSAKKYKSLPIPFNTFNSRFIDESSHSSGNILPTPLGSDLNQAIENATLKVSKRFDRIEPYIFQNNAMQKPGSVGWFVGASHQSSELAKNLSRWALVAEETSKILVKRHKLNLDQIVFGLTKFDLRGTPLWRKCPKPDQPVSCYPGKYRSYSGHCNHVDHADWGAANSPFARTLAPRYADGVAQPRRSITGAELPSPRDVSIAVHHRNADRAENIAAGDYSHVTTVTTFFGQFIFHDIAHAAQSTGFDGQRIRCCGIDRSELMHPECFPIKVVASKDPFMSKLRQECIEYVRSCPAIRSRCALGPREQINQVSSFVDGSALYGSSKIVAMSLRTFDSGQLKAIRINKNGKELLPMQEGDNLDCKLVGTMRCFKSGDDRVNENLGLAIIHTLFLREHNRIARTLATINAHWNDEIVFEETRKIVIAQLQHVTYNEFLPYVLGEEAIDKYQLRLLGEGFYDGYDMRIDATVNNAVANAVLDFLVTIIPATMERYSKDLSMLGYIKISDSYFKPSEMYSIDKFDQYLMGMVSQNARNSDRFVVEDMTNGLSDDEKEGFDFVAFAIQRGRDHGLPGYTEFRRACQIEPTINSFEDLATVVKGDVLKRLSSLYKDVRDIDLFTGGLAEKPLRGALVGPTFACLLARQFDNLRKGDRFWYENDLPPSSFTKQQLNEIRKTSLARILCDNGDRTDFVQPLAMISSDVFLNAFQYCSTSIIGQIDLDKWRDTFSPTSPSASSLSSASHQALQTLSSSVINSVLARARRESDDFFAYEHTLNSELSLPQLMHYKTVRAKRQSIAISNQSLVLEKATRSILKQLRHGRDREASNAIPDDLRELVNELSHIEIEQLIRQKVLTENQYDDNFLRRCDDSLLPCDHTSPFRTITGWCNNLANAHFGKGLSIFERFLPSAYDDGIGSPRLRSAAGKKKTLPSPRLISTIVHDDTVSPHVRYSLATMQWGQFLDHDITFTPMYLTSSGQLLDCRSCESQKSVHPECRPIPIPPNDPYFSSPNGKRKCLHFVRSMNGQRTLGAREQLNQLTSYIDASNVYGSENCEADRLRLHLRGMLNSTRHPSRSDLKDLLPQISDHPECKAPSGYCFLAGDLRASEQPALASMHTMFMREHNRLAEQLSRLNPHWNDERLYQTARKIVSAFAQQITYGEFLPRLIGADYLDRYGLTLLQNGYYSGYDSECSATMRNEIAAAVLRLGHTLLKPSLLRLDVNYKTAKKPLMLREAFFNSDVLYEPFALDELLRGIVTSSIETFDSSITEEVTNHLFEERRKPFSGMDLIALNIQRARDHGLQPYNRYREFCNLTRARRFEDLSAEIPAATITKLRRVYDHVDDIDLFSGGISETALHGALVGPTFGCLLGIQFNFLRKCDRFWYENEEKFTRFTELQLAEIRKVKLSKIICTNADNIPLIQKQAMDMQDPFVNPRISCQALPSLDINQWKDFERSCLVNNKLITIGKYRRISPCVNCVCTHEGMICRSVRVDDCRALSTEFSQNDIMSDQACVVQCAFTLRDNRLQTSSIRSLMSTFSLF